MDNKLIPISGFKLRLMEIVEPEKAKGYRRETEKEEHERLTKSVRDQISDMYLPNGESVLDCLDKEANK